MFGGEEGRRAQEAAVFIAPRNNNALDDTNILTTLLYQSSGRHCYVCLVLHISGNAMGITDMKRVYLGA